MKRFILTTLILAFCAGACRADEGMWLPSLIGSRIKDMKSKGFYLSAEDIYSINRASMKDAVVKFGNGCSAELISGQGLLLTNHHCGYAQIQQHSSLNHDYLTNGFWAMNRSEELPNPKLTVTFLVRMDDVTAGVLKDVVKDMTPDKRSARINANKKALIEKAVKNSNYKADIESFYYGNQYFLFIYEIYEDVRLVAAPPSSIGKFGGDTDNWMWPRHTGDFSLFRIYAGKDNKPAKYSKENVPYIPKQHFKISTKGIEEGDFTFIYGLPARTTEYVTSDAVDYVLNVSNPARIKLRTMRLDQIKQASDKDPLVRIQYAAKAAAIANGWKKWQGESKGIARLKTIERKKSEEAAFEQWAASLPASDPDAGDYRRVLAELHRLYCELNDISFARDYYMEAFSCIELTQFAGSFVKLRPQSAINEFYKDYSPAIDRKIAALTLSEYISVVPERFIPEEFRVGVEKAGSVESFVEKLFKESRFVSMDKLNPSDTAHLKKLTNMDDPGADPAVKLDRDFKQMYGRLIEPRYKSITDSIAVLYTTYMKGLMAQQPDRDFYPDANFTLRVSYGHVAGYRPEDGVAHLYQTTLDGIIEKDDPAIYDYNVPDKVRELYASKDYGRWSVNGTVPVAFIATNHTSGGNSGSPVLNGHGELIGLNFDRTWLSTMSDIEFDPKMCRNISVDIRYVLFVMEKVGGAKYLLDEMTFSD